jgi:ribosome-binding factor A
MHDPFSEQSKAPRRPLRIASEIMRIMPDLIRRHVKLPDGMMVSIVGVDVTRDLSHATVFFSVIGNDEESQGQKAEKLLNEKRGAQGNRWPSGYAAASRNQIPIGSHLSERGANRAASESDKE